MKTFEELRKRLFVIDGHGYPAYKSLKGRYDIGGGLVLSIDHVQGDPFASPSKLSVEVPFSIARIDPGMHDEPHRRTALEDTLLRRFSNELRFASARGAGSGKSGILSTSRPGPEVLPRSACEISGDAVMFRFEAGFPARGRKIDARTLDTMLSAVPGCVMRSVPSDPDVGKAAVEAVHLADDQLAIRREMDRLGLIAFLADGSILPRESGVSSRPLKDAVAFSSPESMRVEIVLPHRGKIFGMGIGRGVTLIVGGGYHGKSTLLKALQECVYDHVIGDGRELVHTDSSAVKLRAEDGRLVRSVDISPFIRDLPDGRDTTSFSTADASGSTSQAAGVMEALEAGSRVLLMDEDTSATNFMVRDSLMEAVVSSDQEPITPFVERVRDLWEKDGVSSIIVVGSSGSFFPVADTVVQMDRYMARDITERVRTICAERGLEGPPGGGFGVRGDGRRRISIREAPSGRLKVRVQGLDGFDVGDWSCDLRLVEQLVDPEQGRFLAQMIRVLLQKGMLEDESVLHAVSAAMRLLEDSGWEAVFQHGRAECGLALPRTAEICACVNRLRRRHR